MSVKDTRLYARFDIGFDEHDKIYPLSDAAFRALVEATLYARRQLTDGFLAERLAVKRWGVDVLEELSTNDPEKPSLVRVEGGWQIHDFAEHQTTNADIEAKRAAGRKGAASRWKAKGMAPAIAPAIGDPVRSDATTLAKTDTETETKTVSSNELTTRANGEFESVWKAWPKKTEKKKSLEQFKVAARKIGLEQLITEVRRFGEAYAATTETQYVPALAVWLRNERWTDEPPQRKPDPDAWMNRSTHPSNLNAVEKARNFASGLEFGGKEIEA